MFVMNKQLIEIEFPGSQRFNDVIQAKMAKGLGLRNCYSVWSTGGVLPQYQVRLGIARRQLVLGSHRDRSSAVRFSDMAMVFFWKYRPTRVLPPTDADVNLSVEQANRDLAELPEARELLQQFAAALIQKGLIKEPERTTTPTPYCYADARATALKSMATLVNALESIHQHSPQLELHFVSVQESLASLALQFKSIDRLLCQS